MRSILSRFGVDIAHGEIRYNVAKDAIVSVFRFYDCNGKVLYTVKWIRPIVDLVHSNSDIMKWITIVVFYQWKKKVNNRQR